MQPDYKPQTVWVGGMAPYIAPAAHEKCTPESVFRYMQEYPHQSIKDAAKYFRCVLNTIRPKIQILVDEKKIRGIRKKGTFPRSVKRYEVIQ